AHSVREFVEAAFAYVGLDWQEYVEIDPRYLRPTEVNNLRADASKARDRLGWEPKISFQELVAIMVDADMEALGLVPLGQGQRTLIDKFSNWHQWDSAVTALHENGQQQFE
ncbi:MAG: GDP-mannose 4,6-dehydratase, partial [Nitrospinota bacterium]